MRFARAGPDRWTSYGQIITHIEKILKEKIIAETFQNSSWHDWKTRIGNDSSTLYFLILENGLYYDYK